MIFQCLFSFFSERVSILETKFSDRKETENMKISVSVLEGNELAAHRERRLTREKPTDVAAPEMPDGLGGNGQR